MGTSNWTVQQWVSAGQACGLPGRYSSADPFLSLYATVAQRNVPAKAPSNFVVVCQGNLIARGLIYFKNTPGDCGAPSPLNLSAAQFAKAGGGIGESGLSIGLSAAQIGGTAAAAATAGLSIAVTAVVEIFQHHAQAVANEQATICKVSGIVNQVIPWFDNLVRQGLMAPSDAYTSLTNYLQQVNAQLETIYKSCNASCIYQGVLDAHADFSHSYYPAIAPPQASAHAPGAPPSGTGTTPGGVISVGRGVAPIPVPSLPIRVAAPDTPPPNAFPVQVSGGFTITTNKLLIGAIALMFLFLLIALSSKTGAVA